MKNDLQLELPIYEDDRKPQRVERGRPWLALFVIIILAGVAIWFWLARDPEAREKLDQGLGQAKEKLEQGLTEAVKLSENFVDLKNKFFGPPKTPNIGTNSTAIPGSPPKFMAPLNTTNATNPLDNQNTQDSNLTTNSLGTNSLETNSLGTNSLEINSLGTKPLETKTPGKNIISLAIPGQEITSLDANILEDDPTKPVAAPVPGGATERGSVVTTTPLEGRQDDAVVRVAFIDDLVQWLVKGYTPGKGNSGQLNINLQSANLRYGVGMKGLAWLGEDLPAGRKAALDYVYTPDMLSALYRLYQNRFMEAMQESAQSLSPDQRQNMFQLYAQKMQGLAGVLESAVQMPDFLNRTEALKTAAHKVVTTNAHYSELVFQMDQARETKNQAQIQSLEPQILLASNTYRQAILQRDQLKAEFITNLKQNPNAQLLDDDTLLFVSNWVERRFKGNPQSKAATLQSATIFQNLAQKFTEASEN